MTLNQVIQRLQSIALAHRQINHFYYGNLAEWLAQETGKVEYPACFVEHNTSAISSVSKLVTHNLRIYFLDMVNKVNNPGANENEVLSDMLTVAGDIIALFKQPDYQDTWYIEGTAAMTLYSEKLSDYVAGVSIDLPVQTFYFTDACSVPATGLPSGTVVIVPTGNDWSWLHYTVGSDNYTFVIPDLIGKTIQGIFRDDMPQERVTAAPSVQKQYTFDDATGTITFNIDNVIFSGSVITIIQK